MLGQKPSYAGLSEKHSKLMHYNMHLNNKIMIERMQQGYNAKPHVPGLKFLYHKMSTTKPTANKFVSLIKHSQV
jgi:hypothetical protein